MIKPCNDFTLDSSTYVWFTPAPQFALYTVYVPLAAEYRGIRSYGAITLKLSSNLIPTSIYSDSAGVLLVLLASVCCQPTYMLWRGNIDTYTIHSMLS